MAEPRGWLATIRGPKHGAPSSWHIVFRREGKLEETAHSWLSTPAGPHPKGLPARRAPNYFVGQGRKKRKKKKKAGKPCEICSISVLIPSYTAGLVLEVTIKSYRGKEKDSKLLPVRSSPHSSVPSLLQETPSAMGSATRLQLRGCFTVPCLTPSQAETCAKRQVQFPPGGQASGAWK